MIQKLLKNISNWHTIMSCNVYLNKHLLYRIKCFYYNVDFGWLSVCLFLNQLCDIKLNIH